jgi:hypothetical protein
MVDTILKTFRFTASSISCVGAYMLLQNAKLKGVITTESNVEMAVILTDKATLPLDIIEKKLDTFPPGQAATRNIPKAIPADGFIKTTRRKVTAGSRIN